MKLDLQPFTLLPPPQVFLAENLHNPSSKNRAFARFLGRTYEKLNDERSVTMSVRLPWTHPLFPDCQRGSPFGIPNTRFTTQNSFIVEATSFVLDGLYSGLPVANRGGQ